MQLSKKTILASLLSIAIFALALSPALAQPETTEGLDIVQQETGYSTQDLVTTVGKIVKLVLGFLGLIALILFIVGGFKWMTSGGNEESIAEAKKLMSAAVVGLFIIIIAYAATTFIVNKLSETIGECSEGQVKCGDDGTSLYVCGSDEKWPENTSAACDTGTYCSPGTIGDTKDDICTLSALPE